MSLEDSKNVISPTDELVGEVVVIGSGPGGAITACLLAEAGLNVLLIEEGAYFPLDSCQPFSQEEMVQKYRNGGITTAIGNPKIQYVEGRCVGGGSEINSGLYHRTPSTVLEEWEKDFEVEALSEADLLPHFQFCEQAVNVCKLPGQAPAASLKLQEGADKLGWQALEVPRWFRYRATSDVAEIPQGKRCSMTETFIPRALQAGCRLLPNTKVLKIHQISQQWILESIYTGNAASVGSFRIRAESVFVCCGAIQTPALLRRSGIVRNIGNSLQMHPTIKLVAQFPMVINSEDMGVPVHQVKEFSPLMSFGCSISSPKYLALAMNDHPTYMDEVNCAWRKMAIYYAMISPQGKGSIRTIPMFKDPLVRYKLLPEDLRTLSEALRKLAMLMFEAGAIALFPSINGERRLTRREDISRLPELLPPAHTNLMTVHVFSSCPMGENQRICAADSFGRVHGFQNLYISDASLLCTAPGVNPQGSIMAIARRNTLKFLGKL
jgi:choline dehydrogenase-like flavoprotein